MKRTLTLLLVFVTLFAFVSCNTQGPGEEVTTEHVHEFVLSETDSVKVSCEADGKEVKVCSCGQTQETVIPATGHDMQVSMETKPTCTGKGSTDYRCANCGKMQYTNMDPLGHKYEETSSEPSRVRRCLNEGCTSCLWNESNGKHTEALTFKFTKEDEAALDAKYDEVKAMLDAAAKYDPALHAYAETGELADAYKVIDAVHTDLYDLVMYAMSQKQLAEIAYYCDMKNAELEETYQYMMDYQTNIIAKFYTLSRPFYDSCYRDF